MAATGVTHLVDKRTGMQMNFTTTLKYYTVRTGGRTKKETIHSHLDC